MNTNNEAIGHLTQNIENIDVVIASATVAVAALTQLTQDSMEPHKLKRNKTKKKGSNKAAKNFRTSPNITIF